jgi:hypothetical protein
LNAERDEACTPFHTFGNLGTIEWEPVTINVVDGMNIPSSRTLRFGNSGMIEWAFVKTNVADGMNTKRDGV